MPRAITDVMPPHRTIEADEDRRLRTTAPEYKGMALPQQMKALYPHLRS